MMIKVDVHNIYYNNCIHSLCIISQIYLKFQAILILYSLKFSYRKKYRHDFLQYRSAVVCEVINTFVCLKVIDGSLNVSHENSTDGPSSSAPTASNAPRSSASSTIATYSIAPLGTRATQTTYSGCTSRAFHSSNVSSVASSWYPTKLRFRRSAVSIKKHSTGTPKNNGSSSSGVASNQRNAWGHQHLQQGGGSCRSVESTQQQQQQSGVPRGRSCPPVDYSADEAVFKVPAVPRRFRGISSAGKSSFSGGYDKSDDAQMEIGEAGCNAGESSKCPVNTNSYKH